MWMWAFAACGAADPPPGDGSTGVLDLVVEPASIDFGTLARGETATRSLVLHNGGTSDVYLGQQLTTPGPAFEVRGFESPTIHAGADEELEVVWTPDTIGRTDGFLRLHVGTAPNSLSDLEVPLVGFVSGADLTPSVTSWDLGVVSVGCDATLPLTLTNEGNEDLVITSLSFTNELDFTIDDGKGAAPILPMDVAAGRSVTLDVVYTPTTDRVADTSLEIVSNDAIAPTTSVGIQGTGIIEESSSMSWTVVGRQAITGIIAPNEETTSGVLSDDVREDFLPAFFDTLLGTNLPFRIAIAMNEDGHVDGHVPYIDDTFTLDEAVDAAKLMLGGHSSSGDNDASLQTCLNAIERNRDWLIDEGELWADSRLNLVGINTDFEQSIGGAEYYLKLYDHYKNSDDLAVHGIAGEPPAGCTSSDVVAIESAGLSDAADATGGVFISVCDEDWAVTGTTLATAFRDGIETFVLDGDPQPSSIVVHVNSVEVSTGWTYDVATRAILFDDATYPDRDSTLRVDYVMAVTCD